MKDREKQIEEKVCKNCIHYQMCVDTFRKGKQDGDYLLIDEDEYFAHANECSFYADKRIYRKQSKGEWVEKNIFFAIYKCSICGEENSYKDGHAYLSNYCPNCGAKMKGE